MGESVILSLPLAVVLYGAALFFCLFDRVYRATKGVFTLISAAVAILATAYCILMGAALWEGAAALTVFLLLNMGVRE